MPSIPGIRDTLQLLRPHQWSKNALVLTPLFFSGHWSRTTCLQSAGAMVAFSLTASAGYCINDIFDRELDRNHPVKANRPIAARRVGPAAAAVLAALVASGGVLLASIISSQLVYVILLYMLLQLLYSAGLKHVVILDLLLLASVYVLRIFAGVAATGITPSNWILIVTGLTALMLATGKRYIERTRYADVTGNAQTRPVLDCYPAGFLQQMMSSTGAVLLVSYLLWCNENVALGRFQAREIFPTAMFVAYGILRYLLLVYQQSFDEDPTRGLLRDRPIVLSVLLFLCWIGAIVR